MLQKLRDVKTYVILRPVLDVEHLLTSTVTFSHLQIVPNMLNCRVVVEIPCRGDLGHVVEDTRLCIFYESIRKLRREVAELLVSRVKRLEEIPFWLDRLGEASYRLHLKFVEFTLGMLTRMINCLESYCVS